MQHKEIVSVPIRGCLVKNFTNYGLAISDSPPRCEIEKLPLAIRAAGAAPPVLDLKGNDRYAIDAKTELRSDIVAARMRRQKLHALGGEAGDIDPVQQRFPFHFAGRAVKDDHPAVVVAVLEVAQLAKQIYQGFHIADACPAEIGRLAIAEFQLAHQHERNQPHD